MTTKAVTTAQLEQVRKMAGEKGIGKDPFQVYGLDGGIIARALDEVKQRLFVGDFIPPSSGRVHIVRGPVQPNREWQEAINAAGPDTPGNYNVRKVGDQYPPKPGEVVEAEIVLINFGLNGGTWDRAIAWAEQYRLKRTNPRHVFAIGEHKPQLHRELGFDYMYVVATEECLFEGNQLACNVWWDKSKRKAFLHWVSDYGSSNAWFAFLRE